MISNNEEKQLLQIAHEAIANFSGDIDVLNSAIGMLFTGYYFGWRFLYIVHSKRTIRKYEKVLNIKIKEHFEPIGTFSYRSAGLSEAYKHSNFWKCVSGDIQIPNRKQIMDFQQSVKVLADHPSTKANQV